MYPLNCLSYRKIVRSLHISIWKGRSSMVSAAAYHSIKLGNIRITYLPDGYILFNQTALFPTTTTEDWQHYRHLLNNNGQLVGSLGAYVIQTPNHMVLVDTGFGPKSFEGGSFKAYGGELLSSLKLAGLD